MRALSIRLHGSLGVRELLVFFQEPLIVRTIADVGSEHPFLLVQHAAVRSYCFGAQINGAPVGAGWNRVSGADVDQMKFNFV